MIVVALQVLVVTCTLLLVLLVLAFFLVFKIMRRNDVVVDTLLNRVMARNWEAYVQGTVAMEPDQTDEKRVSGLEEIYPVE